MTPWILLSLLAIVGIVAGVAILMKTPSEIWPTSRVICGPNPAR